MPRSKREVEENLRKKGFCQEDGDHHFFVYVTTAGKKTRARTKTSHTAKMKEIPDNLLSQMARQCKLTKPQFLELVDCSMIREAYEDVLRNQQEL